MLQICSEKNLIHVFPNIILNGESFKMIISVKDGE